MPLLLYFFERDAVAKARLQDGLQLVRRLSCAFGNALRLHNRRRRRSRRRCCRTRGGRLCSLQARGTAGNGRSRALHGCTHLRARGLRARSRSAGRRRGGGHQLVFRRGRIEVAVRNLVVLPRRRIHYRGLRACRSRRTRGRNGGRLWTRSLRALLHGSGWRRLRLSLRRLLPWCRGAHGLRARGWPLRRCCGARGCRCARGRRTSSLLIHKRHVLTAASLRKRSSHGILHVLLLHGLECKRVFLREFDGQHV